MYLLASIKEAVQHRRLLKYHWKVTNPLAVIFAQTLNILRQCKVLMRDKISCTNKFVFNAIDQLFRNLNENFNGPIGVIRVIVGGYYRQILRIFQKAGRHEIEDCIVKRSISWPKFKKLALTVNQRLNNPTAFGFGSLLVDVGGGKVHDYPGNQYYDSYVKIPSECIENTSLIDSIYGEKFKSSDIEKYQKYALLSTINEDVDFLNDIIYNRMIEDVCTERIYLVKIPSLIWIRIPCMQKTSLR